LEVPEMNQAVEAYRATVVRPEFKELERLRSLARHNEASALEHARQQERARWEGIVAVKDAEIAARNAVLADKEAEKAALLARIAELERRLGESK
jgi:hypothetical protein